MSLPEKPAQSEDYWAKLCQKLQKENQKLRMEIEELKEKLRSFRGY